MDALIPFLKKRNFKIFRKYKDNWNDVGERFHFCIVHVLVNVRISGSVMFTPSEEYLEKENEMWKT